MKRSPLFTLPLVLLLAATACSEGEEAPEQAAEAGAGTGGDHDAEALRAAEGFVASLQSADGEAGCALMDEAARTVLAEVQGTDDCVTAFPPYSESLQGGEGIEVGEVVMDTDLGGGVPIATVTLVYPGEDHGPLEMRQDSDDQWVATRLPGTTLGGA